MSEAVLQPPEFDEMNHDDAIAHLRSQQNFALAVPAGLAAAIVGAIVWAVVVYATNYEVGLMAIAVGALVGIAIRAVGKGVDQKFGFLGAGCAALGWALGMAMADIAMLAKAENLGIGETVARLGLDGTVQLFMAASEPMDFLFLAIAVFEGYKFAFRYRV